MHKTRFTTLPFRRHPLAILAMLCLAPALATFAQVTPPTPQSVAPNYTPSAYPTYSQPGYNTPPPTYIYVPTRARTWDFYLLGQYNFSSNSTLHNQTFFDITGTPVTGDIKMKFKDSFTFGIGLAYNITEQLSVFGEFTYGQPDYEATFNNIGISGTADETTGDFGVRYDLVSKGPLRPFIAATLGYEYVDTGIPTGPSQYICWWDYWWGYSCTGATPTASKTWFTLGAVAGLRYSPADHFNITLSYGARWVNTSHEWVMNSRINLALGWNY